jgi:hypothetical protein
VNWTARLRLVQLAGILLLVECIRLSRSMGHEWKGTLTVTHWFLIVAGVWSGILGFTVQRRIVNRRRPSASSTPFTRWRAGHIVRLVMAYTVGLYGFCLSMFAGPPLVVNSLFGMGLLLLLVWMPGQVPGQAP